MFPDKANEAPARQLLQDKIDQECEQVKSGIAGSCGQQGIGSDTLHRTRMKLHQRLSDLEFKAQQVREALEDTNDPAVQKVMRIFDLT